MYSAVPKGVAHMIILPTKLSTMKDSSSVFFIDLYVLHLASGDLHIAAADITIPWYSPGTTTPVIYKPQPIEREALKQTVDNRVDTMTIRISNVTDDFTSALFQSFDFRGSEVEIIRIAYPDSLGDPDAYQYVFPGYIDAPSLDMSKGTFEAQLKTKMPNYDSCRTVMKSCNAWFGDPDECGVTQVNHSSTVGANSTQYTIYDTSLTQAANYWKSGVCIIGFEAKKVISSAVGSITVEYPFYSVPAVGVSYTVVTGCDKSQTDCRRWGNLTNYSGFPSISTEYLIKT